LETILASASELISGIIEHLRSLLQEHAGKLSRSPGEKSSALSSSEWKEQKKQALAVRGSGQRVGLIKSPLLLLLL